MAFNLHLFSTPGEDDLRYIVEASRPYLEHRDDPSVAYLPLASLYAERWQDMNVSAFRRMARLDTVNAELMELAEMEDILMRASVVYIPGGNTFLLNHRLHISGLMPLLRRMIQRGLPLVGFSAGTIICGPNILTSKDLNTVPTGHFEGLKAAPFNFLTHYGIDPYLRSSHDEWLGDYHFFHDNPVIMLCDGAYVRCQGRKTCLVRGEAWILRKGRASERLEPEVEIHV